MPDNGNTADVPEMAAASTKPQVQEMITVPDRDLSPPEMAKIMRQVARVCNFLGSLIMKHSALSNNDRTAGAGHPVVQSILTCAAQADAAAVNLAPQPPHIMPPGGVSQIGRRH
jgi:hypothetical protein